MFVGSTSKEPSASWRSEETKPEVGSQVCEGRLGPRGFCLLGVLLLRALPIRAFWKAFFFEASGFWKANPS